MADGGVGPGVQLPQSWQCVIGIYYILGQLFSRHSCLLMNDCLTLDVIRLTSVCLSDDVCDALLRPFLLEQVNEIWICDRKVQWLVKTFFKMSKSQTVWPLGQLTSKSSCTRYLKNAFTDFNEIQYVYSDMHGEYLYSFWGLGKFFCII